jgi:4-amino-4-deoxy-L-arabinose transferase-like glycosyltransferase
MKPENISEQPGLTETVSLWDETRSQKPFLFALLFFSLACRLILIQFKDVVGTDEVIYLALGKNLWHGLGFRLMDHPITMCPPLLPILAGFFSLFTENLELGTNIVYVAFGGGMVVPYFYLARRIYGVRVARWASFFLSFFPGLLLSFYWGSMTEPLYTFLLVTALLLLHKGLTEGRGIDFCLAGVFLAFVYLTRSEGLLFFLVLFSFAVLTSAAKRCLFRKKTLRNLLLMALSWSLISAPYPIFLKKSSGELSISGKTKLILLVGNMGLETREGLAGRLNEEGTEFFNYTELVKDKTVLGMILENPKVLVGGSFLQFKNFFVTLISWKVFPAFLLGFVLLGLFRDPWDRARLEREVFLVVACVPFLVFLTFRIWPRYLLPMTPVLLLWAARGVTALEDWIRQTSTMIGQEKAPMRRWVLWLPGILLSIPLLAILVAKPIKARMLVQYPVEYRAAGNWMDENLPADALILTRKPEVSYYAKRLMHPVPNEELPAIVRYARSHGIDYLVVDEFYISTRPKLAFLLDQDHFPEELRLLYEEKAPNDRKVRIFQIAKEDAAGPAQPGD